jgi:hypothetical protein
MVKAVIIEQGRQDSEGGKRRVSMVRVPTLFEGLKYLGSGGGFQEDLELVLDTQGLSVSALARSISVSRGTVSRWRSGLHLPREPLSLFVIMLWADQIRKKKEGNNHG